MKGAHQSPVGQRPVPRVPQQPRQGHRRAQLEQRRPLVTRLDAGPEASTASPPRSSPHPQQLAPDAGAARARRSGCPSPPPGAGATFGAVPGRCLVVYPGRSWPPPPLGRWPASPRLDCCCSRPSHSMEGACCPAARSSTATCCTTTGPCRPRASRSAACRSGTRSTREGSPSSRTSTPACSTRPTSSSASSPSPRPTRCSWCSTTSWASSGSSSSCGARASRTLPALTGTLAFGLTGYMAGLSNFGPLVSGLTWTPWLLVVLQSRLLPMRKLARALVPHRRADCLGRPAVRALLGARGRGVRGVVPGAQGAAGGARGSRGARAAARGRAGVPHARAAGRVDARRLHRRLPGELEPAPGADVRVRLPLPLRRVPGRAAVLGLVHGEGAGLDSVRREHLPGRHGARARRCWARGATGSRASRSPCAW